MPSFQEDIVIPQEQNETLSDKETREIVTPYAFGVSPDLLGKKLASPTRRAFAQLIDLALVALLSKANALFLGFFAALTFLRAGQPATDEQEGKLQRRLLRWLGALMLFVVTFFVVQFYNNAQPSDGSSVFDDKNTGQVLSVVEKISMNACEENSECLQKVAQEFGNALGETPITYDDAMALQDRLLDDTDLEEPARQQFIVVFEKAFAKAKVDVKPSTVAAEPELQQQDLSPNVQAISSDDEQDYSALKWLQGIIADLGLGFGWAALYYTVFTSWWKGHTPGKRLLGIKVLKLDGSSLTLWESFGRYGGYGAGLATGLLGFLQIYWDANRQAIQDKISETLVIVESHKE